ncbi:sulfotransferase domain-containing protein [Halobacillus sp. SY10]|uniref:sulfotransferase domain-containing protein n=1 Tax=Halobacillus sp. SY10 TaxID=3381356 RepID=UPI00387A4A31
MREKKQKPILVTGSPRGGTTFVGKILSLNSNIGYIQEPFNREYGLNTVNQNFLFTKKGAANENLVSDSIRDLMKGQAVFKRFPYHYLKRGKKTKIEKVRNLIGWATIKSRPNFYYQKIKIDPFINRLLIKDPMAYNLTEYMHQEYNCKVVIVIRHPAAFVSSMKRLEWQFGFDNLLKQEELIMEHPYLIEYINRVNSEEENLVLKSAVWWNCIYSVLSTYAKRNPNMIIVKHEDLSLDPVSEFHKLYNKLGINFNNHIEKKIKEYTGDKNPVKAESNRVHVLKRNSKDMIKSWKKNLTESEISLIKETTKDLANHYYNEDHW